MCGIAGQISFGESALDLNQVNKMVEALYHRGPDHQEVKVFGNAALAHTRLSLLDFSENGHQPFYNKEFALVYNGEIYNYKALRDELICKFNIEFISNTDTEVLFHSLIRFGVEKTLANLQGMFAFAFYNLNTQELILARDRLGIKPCFYQCDGNRMSFASELKAFKQAFNLQVNSTLVMAGLSGNAERSRKSTMFQGVKQLTPGHYITFNKDGRHEEHTWFHPADLVDFDYHQLLESYSDQQIVDEFSSLFSDSVKKMLVADASIGAFVSGGIDSSLITSVAKKNGVIPKAYSVNVKGRHSEIAFARQLMEQVGGELNVYDFEPEMFLRDWVKTTWFNDAPVTINPHAVPFGNLTRVAKEHGEKAVLTGEGADELFLGYPVHVRAAFDNALVAPWRWINKLFCKLPGLAPQQQVAIMQRNEQMHNMQMGYEEFENSNLISQAVSVLPLKERRLQSKSLELLTTTLHALLWRNDRMGMMNSIESRFPFLDEAILKFAANLPVKHKIRKQCRVGDIRHPFHVSKHVVRQAAVSDLSSDLVKRRKYAFRVHAQAENHFSADFFKGGFWQDFIGLSDQQLAYMCSHTSNYMLGNIASMDIWGRLNVQNASIDQVSEHLLSKTKTQLAARQLSDL
ncbi:asparagine synthase (glutamine-hydrolyzing) [Motilimonas pumila]|uniref:asparagine synthase (glutamine-hydrolyzing) n=1 Tax=Motilimonas pumila TaxID=2303987 RepID=A0A418YC56_9GAMM|nr:asparagine synthase (glutamine-hydrolyzing) [Motilimonas pumila]RJG42098.1 asparagine synthase (glutamine-hydrolyzing) [Motilimonas pumila]